MRSIRTFKLSLIIVTLLLTNLVWLSYNGLRRRRSHDINERFRLETLQTNNMAGVGLFDAKTGKPIWTRFGSNDTSIIENYFFKGNDLFDVLPKGNDTPAYSVYFRGKGKGVTWWLSRGADTFTDRIVYDTNGGVSRHEILLGDVWCLVDRKNDKNGILLNGLWHQLRFDTNHLWVVDGPTTKP